MRAALSFKPEALSRANQQDELTLVADDPAGERHAEAG